jgi:glutamate/tyrosine decarboxylase-like PLP-dependent enzyme
MDPELFRSIGYRLVDSIAGFLASLPQRPLTKGEAPAAIRDVLPDGPMPERGQPAGKLLEEAAQLLFEHSLFNGHPRFWGYITSSAAPLGSLGDFLASAVNPNVGAWMLSPMASEIEAQTVRWTAELIGYPGDCGGLLVSGGNAANFVGLLAARKAKVTWDVRGEGLGRGYPPLLMYASRETHTWIQKGADIFGFGTNAIRWIPTDGNHRMDVRALKETIVADRKGGAHPFLVVGTAGSVGVGAIDPLTDIAAVCSAEGLWFHVDGAYGAVAGVLPEAPGDLRGMSMADSVAVDPHKWLYAPLEAGCALVRDPRKLLDAFSFHPEYYNFGEVGNEQPVNYYELGLQNSRGFRALKVWLALRHAGKEGIIRMVRDDIALARTLYEAVRGHPRLEAHTQELSITTFRFVPEGISPGDPQHAGYLNEVNRELLNRLQAGGEAFVSNAVIGEAFVLRACVVNFRTAMSDILALPEIVVRAGEEVVRMLRGRAGGPASAGGP